VQNRIDNPRASSGLTFKQFCGALDVREKNRDLFPFLPTCDEKSGFFGEVFRNVGIGRRYLGGHWAGVGCSLAYGLTTVSAKIGTVAIRLTTVVAGVFEACPAVVAESGIGRIIGLAARADHDIANFDDDIVRAAFESKPPGHERATESRLKKLRLDPSSYESFSAAC
jgi:hypothetical protein